MIKKVFCLLLLLLIGCEKAPPQTPSKPIVLVSIAPYRFLVEQIARDRVEVQSIVPPNTNPHIFEPTSKQVAKMTQGTIWFQIGEPFEKKIEPFLKEKNPTIIFSDLREDIELLPETETSCHHCSKDHLDRHIWLSPKLASFQAEKIEKILSLQWPENRELFQKNLSELKQELLRLNAEIGARLEPLAGKTLLVSHPAFGYFCKEYGLHQISVEYEGKEARPRHLEKVKYETKRNGLKTALTLPQYNNKGTLLIAQELELKTQMIDPYSSDYFTTLKELTEILAP
jgi:zinc transport system substrate-binding protein